MSKLYHQYIVPAAPKMYRYALSILKDADNAHDVVQECLEKIWAKRSKLPEIKQPEAWVMRITRNQCLDWVKTNRFTVITDQETTLPDHSSADQDALYSDQQKWLDDILRQLPEKQKEIFHLRDVEEMTYQEIAEVMSISIEDVKVSLHRARKVIKTQLEKIYSYGIAN